METVEVRKQSELAFHNERFRNDESDNRVVLNRWYDALHSGGEAQIELVKERGRNKAVLEYGCSDGRLSLVEERIAQVTTRFYGIDLSDCAIDRARELAEQEGLRHCQFDTMDAEQMTFADNQFDVVFGRGIIHHLDLERSFAEIRRVLRPGGVGIFYEPMGHNPVLNNFRKRTPEFRTPDEHPLVVKDFYLARKYFRRVHTKFYGLATLAPVVLPNNGVRKQLLKAAGHVDDWLLRLPLVGRNAWHVLMTLTK